MDYERRRVMDGRFDAKTSPDNDAPKSGIRQTNSDAALGWRLI
jgi:hypothetical protein